MTEQYGIFTHESGRVPLTLVIASETALGRDGVLRHAKARIVRAVCVSREATEEWTLNPATGEVTGYRGMPRLRERHDNSIFAELPWGPLTILGVLIIVFSLIVVQAIMERADHQNAATTDENENSSVFHWKTPQSL